MRGSEIRQNKATKQWTIYAPSRRKRPQDWQQHTTEQEQIPVFDTTCPFCSGNEHLLPSIILEILGQGQPRWQTRVVPNKFPALTPEGDNNRARQGIYVVMPGYGYHEVIIESPQHNQGLAAMSTEEVEVIIETYHKRYVELMQTHKNMLVLLFRNHGRRAGTSLIHPHAQIIATGMVPHYIRWREEGLKKMQIF